jgi:hypothetical protein
MIRKTINLLVLYFLQFYLNSLRGKEYFARINLHIVRSQSQSEPGVFGSLEPEPLEEKKTGAGAAWEISVIRLNYYKEVKIQIPAANKDFKIKIPIFFQEELIYWPYCNQKEKVGDDEIS